MRWAGVVGCLWLILTAAGVRAEGPAMGVRAGSPATSGASAASQAAPGGATAGRALGSARPGAPGRLAQLRQLPQLTEKVLAQQPEFLVTGTVTYCDPAWGLLFLQDGQSASFIYTANDPVQIPFGDRVSVHVRPFRAATGLVWEGLRYERLSAGEPVSPKAAAVRAVENNHYDSELVEVTGVLRPQAEHFDHRFALRLQAAGREITVVVPKRDDQRARGLVNSYIRARGVSAIQFRNGEPDGGILFVQDFSGLTVLEQPAASVERGIEAVFGSAKAGEASKASRERVHAVRLQGELLAQHRRVLLLRGEDRLAYTAILKPHDPLEDKPLALGEKVTVEGFPSITVFGRGLEDASVLEPVRLQTGLGKADAGKITSGKTSSGKTHNAGSTQGAETAEGAGSAQPGAWSTLRGKVEAQGEDRQGQTLRLRDNQGRSHQVLLPTVAARPLQLPNGSFVAVQGFPVHSRSYDFSAVSATVMPGIDKEQVAQGAALLALVGGGAGLWVWLLRRKVQQQVATIVADRVLLESRVENRAQALQKQWARQAGGEQKVGEQKVGEQKVGEQKVGGLKVAAQAEERLAAVREWARQLPPETPRLAEMQALLGSLAGGATEKGAEAGIPTTMASSLQQLQQTLAMETSGARKPALGESEGEGDEAEAGAGAGERKGMAERDLPAEVGEPATRPGGFRGSGSGA